MKGPRVAQDPEGFLPGFTNFYGSLLKSAVKKRRAHGNNTHAGHCLFSHSSHAPGYSVEIFHSTLAGCQRTPLLGAACLYCLDCTLILTEQMFYVNT